ncbi:hypothetical protein [Streptomyces sp. NPDC001450]
MDLPDLADEVLAELAAARADEMDADTVNRELSSGHKAIGWWQRQGWAEHGPTIGIGRRPTPPDCPKALAENQIVALWRLDVALREKTFWKVLHESAARADEVLCLGVDAGGLAYSTVLSTAAQASVQSLFVLGASQGHGLRCAATRVLAVDG